MTLGKDNFLWRVVLMKARRIQLRQEVYQDDAWKIADWLDDHEVIQ